MGEHLGIIGKNGAGKSTFLNLIAGNLEPDEGEITINSSCRVAFLEQDVRFPEGCTLSGFLRLSGDEHIRLLRDYENGNHDLMDKIESLGIWDIEDRYKRYLGELGVHLDLETPMAVLSGGMPKKAAIARILAIEPNIILLDEPTNFLDLEQIDWLNKYLNAFKGTFILVSHDTQFLNDTCKIIINIENAQITKYWCSYNEYLVQHEQKAQQYRDDYERQQQQIKKMEEYIAKNKARAATAGMANSRQKMLDRIDVMAKPVSTVKPVFSFPYVQILTRHLLEVKKLEIGYDGNAILPPIDLSMTSDTKMWIRGTNGLGKTTLLKTLMHKLPAISGTFDFHLQTKINYVEQDLEFRTKSISATTFMNEMFPKMSAKEIRSELAKVGLRGDLATKPVNQLSGGEQVKIKLCAIMQKPSNLLILDEPTNHLDVNAKDALFDALQDYKGAILLVTHEPEYANRVCTDIFDIKF